MTRPPHSKLTVNDPNLAVRRVRDARGPQRPSHRTQRGSMLLTAAGTRGPHFDYGTTSLPSSLADRSSVIWFSPGGFTDDEASRSRETHPVPRAP